jgi:hypothetical protein
MLAGYYVVESKVDLSGALNTTADLLARVEIFKSELSPVRNPLNNLVKLLDDRRFETVRNNNPKLYQNLKRYSGAINSLYERIEKLEQGILNAYISGNHKELADLQNTYTGRGGKRLDSYQAEIVRDNLQHLSKILSNQLHNPSLLNDIKILAAKNDLGVAIEQYLGKGLLESPNAEQMNKAMTALSVILTTTPEIAAGAATLGVIAGTAALEYGVQKLTYRNSAEFVLPRGTPTTEQLERAKIQIGVEKQKRNIGKGVSESEKPTELIMPCRDTDEYSLLACEQSRRELMLPKDLRVNKIVSQNRSNTASNKPLPGRPPSREDELRRALEGLKEYERTGYAERLLVKGPPEDAKIFAKLLLEHQLTKDDLAAHSCAHYILATIARKNGQYGDALGHYNKKIAVDDKNKNNAGTSQARKEAGEILLRLGRN